MIACNSYNKHATYYISFIIQQHKDTFVGLLMNNLARTSNEANTILYSMQHKST
jgi:hypothetical protein